MENRLSTIYSSVVDHNPTAMATTSEMSESKGVLNHMRRIMAEIARNIEDFGERCVPFGLYVAPTPP